VWSATNSAGSSGRKIQDHAICGWSTIIHPQIVSAKLGAKRWQENTTATVFFSRPILGLEVTRAFSYPRFSLDPILLMR
jgi:hypothetical protein